jgi:hypothetical protein
MKVTPLGIDLAKNAFQLHGCDANGRAVLTNSSRGGSGTLHRQSATKPCRDGGSPEIATRRRSERDLNSQ